MLSIKTKSTHHKAFGVLKTFIVYLSLYMCDCMGTILVCFIPYCYSVVKNTIVIDLDELLP